MVPIENQDTLLVQPGALKFDSDKTLSENTLVEINNQMFERRVATNPGALAMESLPEYYKHVRNEIIDTVPLDATNILDVGCGVRLLGQGGHVHRSQPDKDTFLNLKYNSLEPAGEEKAARGG